MNDQSRNSLNAAGWSGPTRMSRQRIFFAGFCFGLAAGIAIGMLVL